MVKNQSANYEIVKNYHEQTKHSPHRYARSPGYMDWENQPIPFRLFEGAPQIPFPLQKRDRGYPYSALYELRENCLDLNSLESIAWMLELSMGLSAWKKSGSSEWALRMNPSSGNLHPTECYLVLPDISGQQACVTHYTPYLHMLEEIAVLSRDRAASLKKWGGFGIILTSIPWRESWKYGERAFRYCQHDIGHALGALRYACNLNGWKMSLIPQISEETLDRFLGFDKTKWVDGEREHADCLCWVDSKSNSHTEILEWFNTPEKIKYTYPPNRLSSGHVDWSIIDRVRRATRVNNPVFSKATYPSNPVPHQLSSLLSAEAIIRKRRSAQNYNVETSKTDLTTFLNSMGRTLPGQDCPFDLFPYKAQISLAIFIHNVQGLSPGLYMFIRDKNHLDPLKRATLSSFEWHQVVENHPLYLLEKGDFRVVAHSISCAQDIAADSSYSLGMISRFDSVLMKSPAMYPRLFWEAGLIGQVLYLEAEAYNLRATGIGCFFDDEMHKKLGLKDCRWQSLYHFTVGKHIEDSRLETKPPYYHLK